MVPKGKRLASPRPQPQTVDVNRLNWDPAYQRGPKSKICTISGNWSPDKAGAIVVARRSDGTFWIVDGLQRTEAAKKAGVTQILAVIFSSTGPKYEAEVFNAINRVRVSVSPLDNYRSLLMSGDKDATTIQDTLERYGFTIPIEQDRPKQKATWGVFHCPSAIMYLHQKNLLVPTLEMLNLCWPNEAIACTDTFILGIGKFISIYSKPLGPKDTCIKKDILKSRFPKTKRRRPAVAASEIRDRSKERPGGGRGRSSATLAIACEIVEAYNFRLSAKDKLNRDKLIIQD